MKMESESNLQVTFSKRRSGLFKKASELCTLCGAEVAIIVFSPGKKVFSFGHPSVDPIVDRFLTRNPPQINSGTLQLIEAHRNASVRELNLQLTQVTSKLEAEKKRGEELKRMREASKGQCWWEAPIEQLGLPQLEQLKLSLEGLKRNVAKQSDRLLYQTSSSLPPPAQFYTAGSSISQAALIPMETKNIPYHAKNNMNVGFSTGNAMPRVYKLGYGHGFF